MNDIAQLVERHGEAAGSIIDEQIKANNIVKASVRAAAEDFATMVCNLLDDRNASLVRLAASLRAGHAIMPPVTDLEPIKINVAALLDPPLVPRLSPEDIAEAHLEATRREGEPQSETQQQAA